MSSKLRDVPTTEIKQTRFYGGDDRGVCIQVSKAADYTAQHSNYFDYIQLTRVQAGLVAEELLLFAAEQEVVEEIEDEQIITQCHTDTRRNPIGPSIGTSKKYWRLTPDKESE